MQEILSSGLPYMENKPLTSIRGLAALWVVAHHAAASSPSDLQVLRLGYTAVDLFFILSGIILATVYHDMELRAVGKFWLKRACRVYPAHMTALLILTAIVILPNSISVICSAVFSKAYLTSVFLLQPYISTDGIANPVAWSAGIELGCYVLFPLSIVAIRTLRPLSAGSVVLLGVLVFAEWKVGQHFGGGTSGVPAMSRGLVGFTLGMMIWRVGEAFNMNSGKSSLIELFALGAIAFAVLGDRPDLLPVWFAVLLFALSFDTGIIARLLRTKVLVWLGTISFSIYLLHYPVILVTERFLPRLAEMTIEEPVRLLTVLAITLGLSHISYKFVENPGRRLSSLFGARRSTILSPTAALASAE